MAFAYRVDSAIQGTMNAQAILARYNPYNDPKEPFNQSIRDQARGYLNPQVPSLMSAVEEARYEWVSPYRATAANDAANQLRSATFDLTDKVEGSPWARDIPNVGLAQSRLGAALNSLRSARW